MKSKKEGPRRFKQAQLSPSQISTTITTQTQTRANLFVHTVIHFLPIPYMMYLDQAVLMFILCAMKYVYDMRMQLF